MSSHVIDFNNRNKLLTAKLLNQGYRCHKLRKAFYKFYRHHFDLVSKFNVGLKSMQQGLSEPEFYGDFLYIYSEKYMLVMVLAFNFVNHSLLHKDWVQHKCNTTDCMHCS